MIVKRANKTYKITKSGLLDRLIALGSPSLAQVKIYVLNEETNKFVFMDTAFPSIYTGEDGNVDVAAMIAHVERMMQKDTAGYDFYKKL